MTIRITIRHLPAASTPESLIQLLEQNGINTKQEHVKIQRIFVGKAATKTKSELPSTAFLEIPNDAIGLKICKALETKESPIRVELALLQKVPTRITSAGAKLPGMESITITPGSWKDDPEYLRYEESLKPTPKSSAAIASEEMLNTDSSSNAESSQKKAELAPLVAHMLKEMQAKRNKSAKAEGRKRKAKAEAAANKDESAKAGGGASQKQPAAAPKRGGGSRSKKKQPAAGTGEANNAGSSKKKPAKAPKAQPAAKE